jgi:hypothetical protein
MELKMILEQFSNLVAKVEFSMKLEGPGRACKVKVGDVFTVTNPKHMQDKGIKIMRAKTARLNEGYMLSCEQINQLFEVVQ